MNPGGMGQKEGQATRCWELTIFGLHDYDSLQRREIGCPSSDTPPRHPRPRTSAALPANAAELMTEALTGATGLGASTPPGGLRVLASTAIKTLPFRHGPQSANPA